MKQKNTKQNWKPFLRIIRSNTPWGWMILSTLASCYTLVTQVIMPKLSGRIMAGEIFDMVLVWEFVGMMLLMGVLSSSVGLLSNWAIYRMDRNIQHSLWKKLMTLPMKEYDRITPTSLISRVTSDTTLISTTVASALSIVLTISSQVLILKQIYAYNPTIAFSLLAAIPYVLAVMIIPGRLLFNVNKGKQAALSRFTTFVTERLMNMRLIKASATEEKEDVLGYEAALDNYRASMKVGIMNSIIYPFVSSTQNVLAAVALISGSILMAKGELGADAVIAIYMYSTNIYWQFYSYIDLYHLLKQAQGASAVVAELLDGDSEQVQREQSFSMPDGDIVFDNVSFGYGEKEVLSHVSFTIPQGKTTAIVGPSGAGKTTILSLLERLYTPNEGEIRFGDTPIEKIHLDEWRRAMGYIQQDSPLITGTIRENIAYGLDKEPSKEGMEQAAGLANAADFIDRQSEGFDTDIGLMGAKLSGGERQRIALARMLIKEPSYLLLDEATANLDAENAAAVQKSIAQITKGKTAVIVAHDIKTVRRADRIVVLDKGQVQDIGSHEELYNRCSLYRRYCELLELHAEPELA